MKLSRRRLFGLLCGAVAAPAISKTPAPKAAAVTSVTITNAGAGFTAAPTVTFAEELAAVVRRAYVPRLRVQLLKENAVLAAARELDE